MNRREWIASAGALVAYLARAGGATADTSRFARPALNQIGFLPDGKKVFGVSVPVEVGTYDFAVEDDKGKVVFKGKTSPSEDLRATTGSYVARGDFSPLKTPGTYKVAVDGQASYTFAIRDHVYDSVVRDAARCFYLIRANTEIDDPVTGIKIPAGHASEAQLIVEGKPRDLTGGWYNAGDFGKYTHMIAMSVSHMLRLFELQPKTASMSLSIDRIYPDLPDLLQLARWGIDWLLKMQNEDGSVLHKVDSQPALTWNFLPSDDPAPRAAMAPSSIDAGVFAGVMAHAARIFAGLDAAYARRCSAGAKRAWSWLNANPNVLHSDAYYRDGDVSQETLWAACEMAILNGQDPTTVTLPDVAAIPFFWQSPHVLGLFSLALAGNVVATQKIINGAKSISERVSQDPYGFSPLAQSYHWQSNEAALDEAVVCLYAHHLAPDNGFRDAAQSIFDYVLGRNAMNHCFVTGHGSAATVHPFHWIYNMRKIAMPGWVSGGANGNASGADSLLKKVIEAGTPPAKCFVDAGQAEGSYASNEGETSENAAFVFVAGMLATA